MKENVSDKVVCGYGHLSQANAAFIVRAVNAHEELVEALTYALDEWEQDNRISDSTMKLMTKALATAEKGGN
jgi:hypothetical protein